MTTIGTTGSPTTAARTTTSRRQKNKKRKARTYGDYTIVNVLIVNVQSNDDNEKDTRKGKLEKRSRKAPGSILSTEENSQAFTGKGIPEKKKPRIVSNVPADIEKLRRQAGGKRGRSPTTGKYVGLADVKRKVNDEREREIQLEREQQNFELAEALELLKKGHLFPEETAEETAPTADIANEAQRKAQAEVVRISKTSSNLKGDLQRALRVNASLTMGLVDVLRTRAESTGERTGEEEVRRLREQVEKLSKVQESIDEKFNALKEELEAAKAKTLKEREQKNRALKSLREMASQNVVLELKIKEDEMRHSKEIEKLEAKIAEKQAVMPEPMEIEPASASPPTMAVDPTPQRPR